MMQQHELLLVGLTFVLKVYAPLTIWYQMCFVSFWRNTISGFLDVFITVGVIWYRRGGNGSSNSYPNSCYSYVGNTFIDFYIMPA